MITHEELNALSTMLSPFAKESWTHVERRITNGLGDTSFVVALGPDDQARLDFITAMFRKLPGLIEAAHIGVDAPKETVYTAKEVSSLFTSAMGNLIDRTLAEKESSTPKKFKTR